MPAWSRTLWQKVTSFGAANVLRETIEDTIGFVFGVRRTHSSVLKEPPTASALELGQLADANPSKKRGGWTRDDFQSEDEHRDAASAFHALARPTVSQAEEPRRGIVPTLVASEEFEEFVLKGCAPVVGSPSL